MKVEIFACVPAITTAIFSVSHLVLMVLPYDRLRGGAQEQVQLNKPADGPAAAAAAALVTAVIYSNAMNMQGGRTGLISSRS